MIPYPYSKISLRKCCALFLSACLGAACFAQTTYDTIRSWNLAVYSAQTLADLAADTERWNPMYKDGVLQRYSNKLPTDGLPLQLKLTGQVNKMQSGIEQIPRDMKIPGQFRFYREMFATMLLDVEARYGWRTEKAVYALNEGVSVYYWALQFTKP